MSIGCDDKGTVLFTGYCSLELNARRRASGAFRYPVYARPDALQTNRVTGEVLGWQVEGQDMVPAPDRAALENGLLRGTELFYFDSPLEAFLVHVNGQRDSGSETAPSPIWALGRNDTNTPPSGGR